MDKESTEHLSKILLYCSLWAIWGLVSYLNEVRNGIKFKIWIVIICLIIWAWVGWIAWDIIPDTNAYKNSLISISGIISVGIVTLIQNKWITYLTKKILWK